MSNIRENLEKAANQAYYGGEEKVLEDYEFDLLSEHGLNLDSRNFREKVQHVIAMGSLRKKTNADDLAHWWNSKGYRYLVVMPKLDGCSIAQTYKDGVLVQSVSRGDGIIGSSITTNMMQSNTEKALNSSLLPKNMDVRSEAILPKKYEGKFEKNLRNIVSGRIMAKDIDPDLALIDTVVFDVFDRDATEQPSWETKRAWLDAIPNSVKYTEYEPTSADTLYEELADIYEDYIEYGYAIDGLVVMGMNSSADRLPEATLLPENKVAVKFPKAGVPATVGRIEWQLGQYSRLTPVLILDSPVRIDGTDVSRVSASNYGLLKAAGLGVGASLLIVKSGDIIPFCSEVLEPSTLGLELPSCPACGQPSGQDERGINAVCLNNQCLGKKLVVLQKHIDLFGIDYVSDTTIENLFAAGFDSLEKLFAATIDEIAALPGFGQKTATHIVNSLSAATITEAQLIKGVQLRGIGVRKADCLLSFYGSLANLIASVQNDGIASGIEGFGDIQNKLIEDNIFNIEATMKRFQNLGVEILPSSRPDKAIKTEQINVCATGKAPMPRSEFGSLIQKHNFCLVSSVTKATKILVCANPDSQSSKIKKARSMGIQILDYGTFLCQLETSEKVPSGEVDPPEAIESLSLGNNSQDSLFPMW